MSDDSSVGLQLWTVERTEEIQDCRIFRLTRELAVQPATGKRGEFYILDAPDWVNVVPLTPDRQIVCVTQYRMGSRHLSLEIPGGLVDHGESIEATAARELREETGYTARRLSFLGTCYANPAFMDNRYTAMLAEDVTLTDPTAWDEHEELELQLIPVSQLPELIGSGRIENTYSVLALTWYLLALNGIIRPQRPA